MVPRIILPENAPTAKIELRHLMGDVYVTIQRKKDYIEAKWQGHITADNVVCAAQAYLDLLKEAPCPKLLNDKTEVTGDWQDANDWLQFEWLPQVLRLGLRYLAHVYSFSMFSKLAARELEERITPQLSMKNFYERRLAEEWLLAQDPLAAGQRAATA
ncbi:hypothetical protein [Pontibacter ramchanderi]|uniref:SpoIIAA-like protein n=1 Tax=Pontibacter ramchanderi TaxID=1179743 RepID=A0A2N3U955_9BACT|nr:hypothetical protein [Pontibacter ramchanderi]PKV63276.1 hypothetical protein BD749_3116 [Pontibacter ramchanderi]